MGADDRRGSSIADRASALEVWALLAAVVVSATAVVPGTTVNVGTPKLATIALLGVMMLSAQAVRTVERGGICFPRSSAVITAGVLLVAFVAAAARGPVWSVSVWGRYGRGSGLVVYAVAVGVLVVIMRRIGWRDAPRLAWAMVIATGIVATHAVLEAAGVPVALAGQVLGEYEGVSSTLGNPNFVSAYLAIGIPFILWAATGRASRLQRIGVLLLAALVTFGIMATRSEQGLVAGSAGAGVVLLTFALRRQSFSSRTIWGVAAVGSGAALAVMALALQGVGPLGALGAQRSFQLRRWYWATAVEMWEKSPLLGHGLESFGTFFRRYRPVEAALNMGIDQTADAPHSVPLAMLSAGGLLLAAAWVALVAVVGWHLVRGLRQCSGDRLLLLGAFGGGWIAYLVQSFVSLDVAPLILVHAVLAGGVVVVARDIRSTQLRVLRARASGGRRAAALVVGVAVLLIGTPLALLPLRADLRASRGLERAAARDGTGAVLALQAATDLAPHVAVHHLALGRTWAQGGRPREALASYAQASRVDPGSLEGPLSSARTAVALNDFAAAMRWYELALEFEPIHVALKLEYAEFLITRGEADAAEAVLNEALAVEPGNATAAELLKRLPSSGTP